MSKSKKRFYHLVKILNEILNSPGWEVLTFLLSDILLCGLYMNFDDGAKDFDLIIYHTFFPIIPVISYIIEKVINFIFIMPCAIILGLSERQETKENQNKIRSKIRFLALAQAYLNDNNELIDDIANDEFNNYVDSAVDKAINDEKIYAYHNLDLDEQNDYLKKVDNVIINRIKIISDNLIKELKNEKNESLKLYCDYNKYVEYKNNIIKNLQKISDYKNNFKDDNDLDEITCLLLDSIIKYLNIYGYFYETNNINYNMKLGFTFYSTDPRLCFQDKNTDFYYELTDDEVKESKENIFIRARDDAYIFLIDNLNTDYFKSIKNIINESNNWEYQFKWKDLDKESRLMLFSTRLITNYLHQKNKNLLFSYSSLRIQLLQLIRNLLNELDKDKGIIFSGVSGEEMISNEFKIYNGELKYFSNVRFEENDTSVETDGLIISERGIFSIEIKNFKFPKVIISKDGQWKKCYYGKGGNLEEEVMKDVGSQMNRHIIITERLFNEHLKNKKIKDKIEIKPMIIIANDKIEIENNSDMIIVRASQIYPNFKKSNCNYSKNAISEIENFINKNKLPAKKYNILNYEKTFENILNMFLSKKDECTKMFNEILRILNEELPTEMEKYEEEMKKLTKDFG